ncbi:MAG: hypothetical protein EA390_11850 [Balneolaceae bacterium]|nr:MAG: hypothetical protein EA390_11850 [Balneolaceae bacterium]
MVMEENQSEKSATGLTGKKVVIISTVVLILLIATTIFVVNFISTKAEKELLAIVNSELAPNAVVDIGNFKLGLFPLRVSLDDVKLIHTAPFEEQTPQKPLHMIRAFELKHAELRGLNLFNMIFSDKWDIGSLTLDGIDLDLVRSSDRRLTDSTPVTEPLHVAISEITITNSRVYIFHDRSGSAPTYSTNNLYLWINNFEVQDPEKPLYTYFENFRIEADSFNHLTEDGFYEVSIEGLRADSKEKTLYLSKVSNTPLLTPFQIASEVGFERDVYKIDGGPHLFTGFDIKSWMKSGDIHIGYAELNGLSLEIERDKTLEIEPRENRPLLNRQFKDLPFSFHADSIAWKSGLLSYTEMFHEEDRIGAILFTDIDLILTPVQNRSELDAIIVQANARFMEASNLVAEFEFYPSEMGNHSVTASLSEMEFMELNSTLENLALVRVIDGNLKSLLLSFQADDNRATGEMTLIYENLELRFLDDEMAQGNISRIKSFIAKTFAIHSSNNDEELRLGMVDYEREKDRSMFNFWWRSIETGLMDTVKR